MTVIVTDDVTLVHTTTAALLSVGARIRAAGGRHGCSLSDYNHCAEIGI